MIFEDDAKAGIRITSVHHLDWDVQKNVIPARKYSCMSFRVLGDSTIFYKGKQYILHSGDVALFKPGITYEIEAGKEELYVVHFEVLNGELKDDILVFHPDNSILMKTLFCELCEIRMTPNEGYYFNMMSILYRIFHEVTAFDICQKDNVQRTLIQPAIQYFNAHFNDPSIRIADAACASHMSESFMRKIFAEVLGQRPLEYLNRLRIKYAKELLKSGYYTIERIALLSGFSDAKYFSTVFKKACGLSPSEYQRNGKQ